MTTPATFVAENDKENAGQIGKTLSKKAESIHRRVLSNRGTFTPARNAQVSKAMSTVPGEHVAQTSVAGTNQVGLCFGKNRCRP